MRPSSEVIRRGGGGPAGLWAQGISGDIPIVLVRIDDIEDIAIVSQLLRAHEYWRMKQLAVDLVILNERASSYVQDLQIALETMVRTSQSIRVGVEGRAAPYSSCAPISCRKRRALFSQRLLGSCWRRRGSLSDQLDRSASTAAPATLRPRSSCSPRRRPPLPRRRNSNSSTGSAGSLPMAGNT